MVEQKDLDTIEKAHLAAERLKQENDRKEALITRMEIVENRMEGRRLLGGESMAGEVQKPELTPEQKLDIDAQIYFKGTNIEKALKRHS